MMSKIIRLLLVLPLSLCILIELPLEHVDGLQLIILFIHAGLYGFD